MKDANNLADELDKLSHELDTDTGRFHSSVMEFEEIWYSLDIYLAEPRVPDTLKERARSKIDELHDALERNDYDFVKSDLSMLKKIETMVELAVEFAEFDKKKRDDYFFLKSELIMLNDIDAMVALAAEFGEVDKEKRDITEWSNEVNAHLTGWAAWHLALAIMKS